MIVTIKVAPQKQIISIKQIFQFKIFIQSLQLFQVKSHYLNYYIIFIHKMVRIIENYTLYEVVGEGAYGKVYRAVNKIDNKEYAVKVIQVKKFQTNKKLQQCTVHQINILTNIQKNQHIITYYDMLKTQNNFYFVYQYCNGGTLEGMLRKQNTLDQKSALLIFKQLLEAFQVLNKYNIMHRDLKPDNIFFHNGVVKVGDFGFCKSLQKAQMTKTMLGSPIYMAPQILNGQIYSNKADIWSVGVVLYEMLYGYCPFQSSSIPKLIQVLKQTQLQFPNDVMVSNDTKNLLRKILTKDPSKRISWMDLFKLKISNEGRILQQIADKLALVDENKFLLKTVKQINEIDDGSGFRNFTPPASGNYNSYGSPKNNIHQVHSHSQGHTQSISYSNRITTNSVQPTQQRLKAGLMKKPQGTVDQGETTSSSSPLKKAKSMQNGPIGSVKQRVLKFHQQLVRGINIVRSMALNNQKHAPTFTYFIFKNILQRSKRFKEQQLSLNQSNVQIKQFRNIIETQCDDLQYQMAMIRNKFQQSTDWKKALRAKASQIKNTRLFYELVMFLSQQEHAQNASQNQIRLVIKSKLG